jgi:hypothetical protein
MIRIRSANMIPLDIFVNNVTDSVGVEGAGDCFIERGWGQDME